MQGSDFDETKASARLPLLDIDIVHRRPREGGAEQLLVSLQAVPSYAAFGRFLEAANPFYAWASLVQMAWLPWLTAFSSAPLVRGLDELPAFGTEPPLPKRTDKR